MPDYAAQIKPEDRWAIVRLPPRAAAERARDDRRMCRRPSGAAGTNGSSDDGPDTRRLDERRFPELGSAISAAFLIAGAAGAVVSLIGYVPEPDAVLPVVPDGLHVRASGVSLGCLALGMVHQLSGGAWGVVIRRPMGAASRVLPMLTRAVPADCLRHASPLRVDARRRRRARRRCCRHKQLVPEHAVLPDSRGDLLRWSGTRCRTS